MFCGVSIIVMSIFMYLCLNGFIINDGYYKHFDKKQIDYKIKHSIEFYK